MFDPFDDPLADSGLSSETSSEKWRSAKYLSFEMPGVSFRRNLRSVSNGNLLCEMVQALSRKRYLSSCRTNAPVLRLHLVRGDNLRLGQPRLGAYRRRDSNEVSEHRKKKSGKYERHKIFTKRG